MVIVAFLHQNRIWTDRKEILYQHTQKLKTIYREVYTGAKFDRPEWKKLRKRLNAGDTVIFDSVSRMSRNADEGINIYMEFISRDLNLFFLKNRI